MAEKVYIIGHKNPDNGAISSAVGLAYLENELARREGEDFEYIPVRLGPMPPETAWVFGQHGLPTPELIDRVNPGDKVVLVDHNESPQAVDGLARAELVGVVDHHRLGDLSTPAPVFITCRPWGSTATIVARMFQDQKVGIPPAIGDVLLSAILTDTTLTRVPATGKPDFDEIAYLEGITGRDWERFGRQLYECRGVEGGIPIERFAGSDGREYHVGDTRVLFTQHETLDLAGAKTRFDEARPYLRKLREEGGYDYVLLVVTGIEEEGSYFILEGNHGPIDRAFGIDTREAVWVPGIVSRKQQVAPLILA